VEKLRWLLMGGDLKLRLLSLLLAVMVWFHAVTEKVYISHATIPIIYKNVPANTVLIGNPPRECQLVIKGKGKMLLLFNMRRPKIVFNLSSMKPGKHTLKLTPPRYREIEVISYTPQKIKIYLDKVVKKKVRVKPVIIGNPPEDLSIAKIEVEPTTVTLKGPATLLAKIKEAKTEEVNISDVNKSFGRSINVVIPEDTQKLIEILPPKVSLTVTFEPKIMDSVKVKVVGKSTRWRSFRIKPDHVTVIYRVPESKKKRVSPSVFRVWVDVDSVEHKGAIKYLTVNYKAPSYVSVVKVDPARVEVVVRR